jgi:hypothetical protein
MREQLLDKFLKALNFELTDWQREIALKMIEDRKINPPFLPRGHGYSEARVVACVLSSIIIESKRLQNIEQMHKDIMSEDSIRRVLDSVCRTVKPDGYSAQLYVIDENPEILEKAEKENLWRKTNPMVTNKRVGKVKADDSYW